MIKKCCDICQQEVSEINSTEITLKDYNGMTFDNAWFPEKRKWKGIICEKCLKEFRNQAKEVVE